MSEHAVACRGFREKPYLRTYSFRDHQSTTLADCARSNCVNRRGCWKTRPSSQVGSQMGKIWGI